jgi:hypothetical protein
MATKDEKMPIRARFSFRSIASDELHSTLSTGFAVSSLFGLLGPNRLLT